MATYLDTQRSGRVRHAGASRIITLLLALAAALLAAGCGGGSGDAGSGGSGGGDGGQQSGSPVDGGGQEGGGSDIPPREEVAARNDMYDSPPDLELDPDRSYRAEVETTKGTFHIDLLPEEGPNAAANFVFLAREGFFDGVSIHRVVRDFVIQTGDPLGDGTGGPGYSIPDDPVEREYERGIVAMANSGPDSGGSQWFVVLSDEAMFAPAYSIFGKVPEEDLAVLDEIASVEVEPGPGGEPSHPVEDIYITSVTIEESEGESDGDGDGAASEQSSDGRAQE